jgi:hypothetical protein
VEYWGDDEGDFLDVLGGGCEQALAFDAFKTSKLGLTDHMKPLVAKWGGNLCSTQACSARDI